MFRNYMKIALRSMRKNALHSGFNVIGLAMGIACSITVYLFIDTLTHMDTFHPDADRVFAVYHTRLIHHREENWGLTKAPIGPALKNDFAEVTDYVRIDDNEAIVKTGDLVFREPVRFVDPNFFEIFNFPMAHGQASDLKKKDALFLSEEQAVKYFGKENPVGRTVTLIINEVRKEFTISGVAKKFPRNASFGFNLLISYENVKDIYPNSDRWTYNVSATFIKLRNASDKARIESQLGRYVTVHNEINPNQPAARFYLENLLSMATQSHKVRSDISGGPDPIAFLVLGIIAVLVMLMACFNYMNITIAAAARRFKEIGIRKVVGSSRGQLVRQFITENMLTGFFSLGLGIVLAETLTVPFLNKFFEGNTYLEMSTDGGLILFLGALVMGVAVISGLYPSLYMSRFQAVKILKDLQRITGNRLLAKSLLVIQFSISLFAIIAGIVFTQNAEFVRNLDLGYESDQAIVVHFDEAAKFERFRNVITQDPRVLGTAGSVHHVGRNTMTNVRYESNGSPSQANVFKVGVDYPAAMGLRLRNGRLFERQLSSETTGAALVNETLVRAQGWTQPVGQRIKLNDQEVTIVGVLEDFFYRSYHRAIDPCILTVVPESEYRYMTIRVKAQDALGIKPLLEKTWREINPDRPFEMLYQDDVFLDDVIEDQLVKDIFLNVAVMTLMIAAMGLFALVSLTIARRTKEIGVRKVLGATALHIIQLINRDFYLLIGVAALIIFPVAFVAIDKLLDSIYAAHVAVGALPFIASVVIFALVALGTIGTRVFGVAKENPVQALKYE